MKTVTRKARSTGTLVEYGMAEVPDDGGIYAAICVPYGGIFQTDSQGVMFAWGPHPKEWCPECQALDNSQETC